MQRHISSYFAPLAGMAAGVLAMAGAVHAEEASGARFTMTPTQGGFVRLDTVTGAVSMCTGKEGEWACKAMPDDQKALQDKIARLEDEVRALKDENRRLEDVLGLGGDKSKGAPGNGAGLPPPVDGGPPAPPTGPKFSLPNEKDVDKAFDYFEGMLKKFQERLKKLEEKDKGGGSVPL